MNKKVIIPTVLFLVILPVSIFALSEEKKQVEMTKNEQVQNETSDAKIILYYSNQCPHCKNVEKYLEENSIKDKVNFAQKEVHDNKAAALELMAKAAICGVPGDEIGVPFLWDGENNRCLMGDNEIITFFSNKTNAK